MCRFLTQKLTKIILELEFKNILVKGIEISRNI
jgi:hypothetical protein